MTEWISVSDRLPKKDIKVLVTNRKDVEISSLLIKRYEVYDDESKYYWLYLSDDMDGIDITHWMPIPELPK